MKLGLIARADRTGLGVQTWEFYRNMAPDKTLVINPTWMGHGQSLDPSMYENYMIMDSKPYPETAMVRDPLVDEFLDGLDVMFTCETPYNYWIFERARQLGVKTVTQYNFEFLDIPDPMPQPDLYIAPSLWHWDRVPYPNRVHLPVPVNRDALPYRHRTELRTILHTAGMSAIHDRNGTNLMIEAMSYVPPDVDVQLRVRSQGQLPRHADRRVECISASVPRYTDLYGDEDAFFIPRKFGGLCLPLNEASACGMPVVMTNLTPQNHLLPAEALLESYFELEFMAKSMIQVYNTTPQNIADKITELYKNPELVEKLSDASNQYAESISWERMKPLYLKVFTELAEN